MNEIKLLIADDEETICTFLKKKFTRLGYTVSVAYDGETTLSIAQQEIPDIILLDVKMPGLSGIEICKKLKSKKQTKHIVIIMFSARAESLDIEIGKEVGADSYICKPATFDKIKEQVDAFAEKIR